MGTYDIFPWYVDVPVVIDDSSFCVRVIEVVAFVREFRAIFQCYEPMRESFWHKQLLLILC